MVGRLVEQQQIGLGKQHRRQRHAHAPAARQLRQAAAPASRRRGRARRGCGRPGPAPSARRSRRAAPRSRRCASGSAPRSSSASSAARSRSAASTVSSGVAVAARRFLRQKADAPALAARTRRPLPGSSRPRIRSSSVDLPAPLRPTRPSLRAVGDLGVGFVEQRAAVPPADAVGQAGNRQHGAVLNMSEAAEATRAQGRIRRAKPGMDASASASPAGAMPAGAAISIRRGCGRLTSCPTPAGISTRSRSTARIIRCSGRSSSPAGTTRRRTTSSSRSRPAASSRT